jgi:hypothetical protein
MQEGMTVRQQDGIPTIKTASYTDGVQEGQLASLLSARQDCLIAGRLVSLQS